MIRQTMNIIIVWARHRLQIRERGPSPPFRGEREGPAPKAWEGEVGDAADPLVGPPHPALSPRPAGGEGNYLAPPGPWNVRL